MSMNACNADPSYSSASKEMEQRSLPKEEANKIGMEDGRRRPGKKR